MLAEDPQPAPAHRPPRRARVVAQVLRGGRRDHPGLGGVVVAVDHLAERVHELEERGRLHRRPARGHEPQRGQRVAALHARGQGDDPLEHHRHDRHPGGPVPGRHREGLLGVEVPAHHHRVGHRRGQHEAAEPPRVEHRRGHHHGVLGPPRHAFDDRDQVARPAAGAAARALGCAGRAAGEEHDVRAAGGAGGRRPRCSSTSPSMVSPWAGSSSHAVTCSGPPSSTPRQVGQRSGVLLVVDRARPRARGPAARRAAARRTRC